MSAAATAKTGFKIYPHGTLAGLGVLAAYMVYTNLLSGPSVPQESRSRSPPATQPLPTTALDQTPTRKTLPRARNEEFHPVLRSRRPEDRVDPSKVDPTLRLDLLAKVMNVTAAGGNRNLFAFSQPQ